MCHIGRCSICQCLGPGTTARCALCQCGTGDLPPMLWAQCAQDQRQRVSLRVLLGAHSTVGYSECIVSEGPWISSVSHCWPSFRPPPVIMPLIFWTHIQNLVCGPTTCSLYPKATVESCKVRTNLLITRSSEKEGGQGLWGWEEQGAFVLAGEGISDLGLAQRRIGMVTGALWGPVFQCHPPQSPTCHSR